MSEPSEGIVLRLAASESAEALLEAALLVRRAGLVHLVDAEVSVEEVRALAHAGDMLEVERALMARRAAEDPASLLRAIDGGKSLRQALVDRLLAQATQGVDRGGSS